MNCPACDRAVWRAWLVAADMFTGSPYTILRCDHCGLARTADDGTSHPGDLYVYGGSGDAGRRFGPRQGILRAFRRARRYSVAGQRPGRALDVGCGDGSYLETLARQGWEVFGTELSESIAATARQRLGMRVCAGAINEVGFETASFDLVTFWHALEHLEDPKLALAEARRLVKTDGQVVVAVPNIESWQARLFKEVWLHLDVPRHRWHFSPRTLGTVANQCGFVVERIRYFSLEYGPFAVLQGIASRAGLGCFLFTRMIRESLPRLFREPLFWGHVPLLAVSAVPSLLFEVSAALCKRGGAVEVVLRPK